MLADLAHRDINFDKDNLSSTEIELRFNEVKEINHIILTIEMIVTVINTVISTFIVSGTSSIDEFQIDNTIHRLPIQLAKKINMTTVLKNVDIVQPKRV